MANRLRKLPGEASPGSLRSRFAHKVSASDELLVPRPFGGTRREPNRRPREVAMMSFSLRRLAALLLALAVLSPSGPASELDVRIKEVLGRPEYKHSRWGLLVVDSDSGHTHFPVPCRRTVRPGLRDEALSLHRRTGQVGSRPSLSHARLSPRRDGRRHAQGRPHSCGQGRSDAGRTHRRQRPVWPSRTSITPTPPSPARCRN